MYKSVLENPLCLECFELQHILEYAGNSSNSTRNNRVVTRMKQGLQLYNDKFLSDLRFFIPEDGKFTITADHVLTLLHAISDYSKQKLYAAPAAKLQTWHQPKAVKTVPLPCQEVFGKPSTYEGPSNTDFNWGTLKDFSLPIFDACMESVEAKYKLIIHLPAVVCSSNIGINEFLDDLTLRKMLFINTHYNKDLPELHEIEKKTVEHKSLEWQNGIRIRLTGSNIKDIATRVKDFENLAASIRRKKDMDISFIPAVHTKRRICTAVVYSKKSTVCSSKNWLGNTSFLPVYCRISRWSYQVRRRLHAVGNKMYFQSKEYPTNRIMPKKSEILFS
ncbi:hypothetical protein AVEN_194917-1 [Araneus ventricosus]|uniref:Uncharacterized protein n=1 Tax=Araneus ventricosus TaxID=182803 RepID=A0A4Y2B3C5_ARAVE|nr:hypothetical protein AVEN_194917-1 [Araneus ventricosus]